VVEIITDYLEGALRELERRCLEHHLAAFCELPKR
jgi:hypothetical protein